MRIEEITVETIDVEPPNTHRDLSPYETVIFRVLPADHPNSFTVPVSVNLSQFGAHDAQVQARFVFHRLMRALAEATAPWDRSDGPSRDDALQEVAVAGKEPTNLNGARDAAPQAPSAVAPASATDARLGPAGDPAEGKP